MAERDPRLDVPADFARRDINNSKWVTPVAYQDLEFLAGGGFGQTWFVARWSKGVVVVFGIYVHRSCLGSLRAGRPYPN